MSGTVRYHGRISGEIVNRFFKHQEEEMNQEEVRIVELPPMRVICINGFGQEPEDQAFKKMFEWAKEHEQLDKPHRLFGFDNPVETPGSTNRGYDVWMSVDESCQADGEARIVNFTGGLYAVMRLPVNNPWNDIPPAWQRLVKWRENSPYHAGHHQWLEEHIGPISGVVNALPFTLDLYLPIAK
jgi:DNA gyrase inhibitor GyrI